MANTCRHILKWSMGARAYLKVQTHINPGQHGRLVLDCISRNGFSGSSRFGDLSSGIRESRISGYYLSWKPANVTRNRFQSFDLMRSRGGQNPSWNERRATSHFLTTFLQWNGAPMPTGTLSVHWDIERPLGHLSGEPISGETGHSR
jgi:hypothetical protein